jgi:hypothetical protein
MSNQKFSTFCNLYQLYTKQILNRSYRIELEKLEKYRVK